MWIKKKKTTKKNNGKTKEIVNLFCSIFFLKKEKNKETLKQVRDSIKKKYQFSF